jgi:hypothetical protein
MSFEARKRAWERCTRVKGRDLDMQAQQSHQVEFLRDMVRKNSFS